MGAGDLRLALVDVGISIGDTSAQKCTNPRGCVGGLRCLLLMLFAWKRSRQAGERKVGLVRQTSIWLSRLTHTILSVIHDTVAH